MPPQEPRKSVLWRAVVEIVFIIFLFYSNLLMGEFDRSNRAGKSWSAALVNILTLQNLSIAVVSATVGFFVFEQLRGKS